MTTGEWSCLISFTWAPPTCSERRGSEKFKMKIYVSRYTTTGLIKHEKLPFWLNQNKDKSYSFKTLHSTRTKQAKSIIERGFMCRQEPAQPAISYLMSCKCNKIYKINVFINFWSIMRRLQQDHEVYTCVQTVIAKETSLIFFQCTYGARTFNCVVVAVCNNKNIDISF